MNSLYGKFGMRLETTKIEMFDSNNEFELELLNEILDNYPESIKNWIKLDNLYIAVRNSLLPYKYNESEDFYFGMDVNVSIAAAVTSGGRIWMSLFKNNNKANLYYSDTDSAIVDKPINPDMIGPKLGQFKLEYIIKKAVFLAPKVYALITSDNELIIKAKGVTQNQINNLNFNEIENLLIKDSSLEFNQEKWFKDHLEGNIITKELIYTLKATNNKRNPVYTNINNKEIFINTKPINYDDIIKND